MRQFWQILLQIYVDSNNQLQSKQLQVLTNKINIIKLFSFLHGVAQAFSCALLNIIF